jgi:hypothetical protein
MNGLCLFIRKTSERIKGRILCGGWDILGQNVYILKRRAGCFPDALLPLDTEEVRLLLPPVVSLLLARCIVEPVGRKATC